MLSLLVFYNPRLSCDKLKFSRFSLPTKGEHYCIVLFVTIFICTHTLVVRPCSDEHVIQQGSNTAPTRRPSEPVW